LCSFRTNEAFESILRFFNGMCATSPHFVPDSSCTSCDLNTYRTTNSVLLGSLKTLHFAYLKRALTTTEDFNLLWLVHDSLRNLSFCPFAPSSIHSFPTDLDLLGRLKRLDYSMRFYVDLYLCIIEQHGGRGVEQVTASLRLILSEITVVVPQMYKSQTVIRDAMDESFPWPWLNSRSNIKARITCRSVDNEADYCALVFALARVIEEAVRKSDSDIPVHRESDVSPALILCRTIALVDSHSKRWPPFPSATRYLFWAGLCLTSSIDPAGVILQKFRLMI
jgi:hypothetical protein